MKEKRNRNDTEDIQKRLVQMLLDYAKHTIVPKTEEVKFLKEHSSDDEMKMYLEKILDMLVE